MTTAKTLADRVGGLSNTTKMPGWSYGIPAKDCIVGSILRKQAGSVCSKCYARKGMYVFPNVARAQARRLRILLASLSDWTSNFIALLSFVYRKKAKRDRYFRWHDSGDIQSPEHLNAILEICRALPHIKFWLPTKERAMVGKLESQDVPSNLVIRVSSPMVGQYAKPPKGLLSSTVEAGVGTPCYAWKRGGSCGGCRKCWDPRIENIDYSEH